MLHVYGQQFWHSDALVVGTREDLERLRNQITAVLADEIGVPGHNSNRETYFPSDGEGYSLLVAQVPEAKMARLPHQCIDEVCGQWSNDEVAALKSLG